MNTHSISVLIFLTLIIVSELTIPVHASKWECGERSNLPMEGKNYCAAGDFRQSQINLKKLLAVLRKKHVAAFGDDDALIEAQTAFENYRDSQCVAENRRVEEKSFHPMIVAQCKTRLTNLRIDEIKRMNLQ
ncbi:MAG: DUF1311 domain-containing protein [Granulosicoccus sp.]|nr:DUF1311 domain-containing protein [Granulosicoccus sp.]